MSHEMLIGNNWYVDSTALVFALLTIIVEVEVELELKQHLW